jgi:hypothetical protein
MHTQLVLFAADALRLQPSAGLITYSITMACKRF